MLILLISSCDLFGPAPRPVTPPRLDPPEFGSIQLAAAPFGAACREAIRLTWIPPATDSNGIRSFTLLRRRDVDTIYDVFYHSRNIPASLKNFDDDLVNSGVAFPPDGAPYICIRYRLLVLDTLGRYSDTSAPCSLYLAAIPQFENFNQAKGCFNWTGPRIQGSVKSSMQILDSTMTTVWTSPFAEEFGGENDRPPFDACLPPALHPLPTGRWFRVFHVEANGSEHQSMTVEPFYVP